MATMAVGAAVALGKAVQATVNFRSEMTLVATHAMPQVISSGGNAQKVIAQLTQGILQMAPAVGMGPDALAKGLYEVESATTSLPKRFQDVSGSLQVLQASAELAAVGHADLKATVDTVTSAMAVYGNTINPTTKQNYDLNAVVGVLNNTVGEGKMQITQLNQALSTGLLPVARLAGISLQSLGAGIATLTDAGIPAGRAATYLRSALLQISQPTNKSVDALVAMGVAVNDANGRVSNFNEVLQKAGVNQTEVAAKLSSTGSLADVLTYLDQKLIKSGVSASQAGQLLSQAFGGIRSGTGMVTLYSQISALQKKEEDATTASESFQKTWEYYKNNDPQYLINSLGANFQSIAIVLGGLLIPILTKFVGIVTPIVDQMIPWVQEHQNLLAVVLPLGIAFTGMAGAILLVGGAFSVMAGNALAAVSALSGIATALASPIVNAVIGSPATGGAAATAINSAPGAGAAALGGPSVPTRTGGITGRTTAARTAIRNALPGALTMGADAVSVMPPIGAGAFGGQITGATAADATASDIRKSQSLPTRVLGAVGSFLSFGNPFAGSNRYSAGSTGLQAARSGTGVLDQTAGRAAGRVGGFFDTVGSGVSSALGMFPAISVPTHNAAGEKYGILERGVVGAGKGAGAIGTGVRDLTAMEGGVGGIAKNTLGKAGGAIGGAAKAGGKGMLGMLGEGAASLGGLLVGFGPELLIIAGAIAAVGIALAVILPNWNKFPGLISNAKKEFNNLKDALGVGVKAFQVTHDPVEALGAVLTKLGVPARIVVPILSDLYRAGNLIGVAFNGVKSLVGQFFDTLGKNMSQITGAKEALGYLGTGLKVLGIAIGAVAGIIAILLGGVFEALLKGLSVALPAAIQIVIDVINLVGGIIKLFADLIKGVVKIIVDLVHGDWGQAWKDIEALTKTMFNDIVAIFQDLVKTIWDILKGAFLTIVAVVWGFIQGVIGAFQNLWDTLVGHSIIPDMVNAILSWFQRLWQLAVNIFNTIKNDIVNVAMALYSWFLYWGNLIWQTFVNNLNLIKNEFQTAWNWISQTVTSTMSGMWNSVTYWIGVIASALGGFRDSVGTIASDIGTKLHDGIVTGIKDIGSALANFLNGLSSVPGLGDVAKGWATTITNAMAHLATGGMLGNIGAGFVTNKPTAIVGEGGPHPEYVIPTDPRYKANAAALWASAGQDIGMMASGGVLGTAQMLATGGTVGSYGGECVVFVENVEGMYWPVEYAAQMTKYVNSQIAKAGELAVFTGGGAGHVAILEGAGDGNSWPVIDSNWVAPETVGEHQMNKSMYGFAGFIDLGKPVPSGISGSVSSLLSGPESAVASVISSLGGWEATMGNAMLGAVENNLTNFLSAGNGPGSPVALPGSVTDWLHQAETLAGVNTSWDSGMTVLIGKESGGNPNAVNSTPVGGQHATGIAQMLQSTFNAYAVPGHGNIMNPVDNLASSIRYIMSKYGSISGIPGLQGGNYQGYAHGGILGLPTFDNGGILPAGPAVIATNSKTNEYVYSGAQQDAIIAELRAISQQLASGGGQQEPPTQINIQAQATRDMARQIATEISGELAWRKSIRR